jgi:hypothetical protein
MEVLDLYKSLCSDLLWMYETLADDSSASRASVTSLLVESRHGNRDSLY